MLGGAQLAVGAAAIFARYALAGAGPLAVAAGRLAIASAILWCAAPAMRGARPRVTLTSLQQRFLAVAGVALAVHFATWIWSLEYISVASSVLLVTSTPIWTAIYDAAVNHRRLSRPALGAFAAGGLGIALVVGRGAATAPPPIPGHAVLGAILALTGSVAIGAYFLLAREVRTQLGTFAIVQRTFTWAAVALIAAAIVARQPLPPPGDTSAWMGIVALALVSQLLGHTALNASLRWFSPSAVAFATLLEPAIAAGLALLLFGEALAPLSIIGGLVLLASVAVVMRQERIRLGTRT